MSPATSASSCTSAAPDTLLAWVGHHDAAYAWAERRRLEVHPTTGAAQLVEVRERIEEIVVPVAVPATKPPLFARTPEPTLLLCGVPPDWLADVRAATEDTLFDLADHLPEAMEALLNLALGVQPAQPAPTPDLFTHPDAQRRFRLLVDSGELRRALEAPGRRGRSSSTRRRPSSSPATSQAPPASPAAPAPAARPSSPRTAPSASLARTPMPGSSSPPTTSASPKASATSSPSSPRPRTSPSATSAPPPSPSTSACAASSAWLPPPTPAPPSPPPTASRLIPPSSATSGA